MGQPGQTSLSERLRSIEAEIAAGQAESALAHCQEIFAQYPRALAVQRVLGEIYLALRKPREALGALDRALAGDPEDARACCARAIIHQMHGDPIAALAWYRRACDARPDDQTLSATYRDMASRLKRPPYHPTRLGLARLYMRGALFTHAIREWETLIAENSDQLEAQVGLVETLWRVERLQEAEDWARRVLMNAPSCVKPLLIVGVIARDTGRAVEADRFLQRAAELDPDHRIARALFADRSMGDASLRALFWSDDLLSTIATTSAPGGQRISFGAQRATDAPRAERRTDLPLSAPISPMLNGTSSLADLETARSRPDLSASRSRPLPPSSRPQNLPPEFHSMFKETENMLWGPEHSDPGLKPTMAMPAPQQSGATSMTPGAGSQPIPLVEPPATFAQASQPLAPAHPDRTLQPPPYDSSAQFVPPAIAESQTALGDTETRRAIRWVQWLQAQGARMRSDDMARGRPTGSLDALFNSARQEPVSGDGAAAPSPWPFGGRPAQPPVTSLATGGPAFNDQEPTDILSAPGQADAAPFSGPLTGALPPPKPEELRQMFAQLEPSDLANEREGAQMSDARDAAGDGAYLAERDTLAEVRLWQLATPPASPEPPASAEPREGESVWPAALADAFEWPSQPGASTPGGQPTAHAASAGHPSPDVTLEALEGAHAANGYQPFTLEPGSLAAFTGSAPSGAAPASEAARALDEFFQGPEEPPLTSVAEEPSVRQPAIAPNDYPARLEAARSLRAAGALDESLVEYRALLKNAPDLLADVMSDLQASLDEQPEHPELHRLLSDARIQQGDYMAAIEALNRSVSLSQLGDE